MLTFASICPHPPIIIPTIGQSLDLKKASLTIKGMKELAEKFKKAKPETVIVISPHGSMLFDYFCANLSPAFFGNFHNFGDFKTELSFENDLEFISLLGKECQDEKIPLTGVKVKELDHGALVPLYYLSKQLGNFKVVPLSFSYLDIKTHFEFGKVLGSICQKSKKRIAIVASGDMSHRLTPTAPAGFSPKGKEFDEKLAELLKKKDVDNILNLDPVFVETAGECGYHSVIIVLGALSNFDWQPEILSYQGPFGVGYLVANFNIK